jgi:hypothetical protein
MAQKTAVEWLEIQFDKYTSGGVNVPNNKIFKLTEKAKAMEKEQIINAYGDGVFDGTLTDEFYEDSKVSGEQYYNETYGEVH